MKEKFNKILPRYTYIPLLTVLLFNTLVYNASKLITNNLFHYNFSSFLDSKVPLIPFFVLIYLLAYVQWIVGYIVIARESKEVCYRYCSADLIAKLLCLLCFLIIPTTMVRPELSNGGLLNSLLGIIYMLDAPVNLFPSIHCLESWMVFRGSLKCHKVSNSYRIIMLITALFVFLSTIFVHQHIIIDIFGGIIVCEIGIWFAYHFNTAKLFFNLEKIFNKDDHHGKKKK